MHIRYKINPPFFYRDLLMIKSHYLGFFFFFFFPKNLEI